MNNIELFCRMMEQTNVMLLAHRGPDGDTLGSCFALKNLYESLGKRAFVACSDPVPHRLAFVTDGQIELSETFHPDTIICVDIAEPKLLGDKYTEIVENIDFCIDHHYTNPGYAKFTILDADKSSVGELIYDLIKQCGYSLNCYIAEKLYTAISYDTGCFKYSNTKSSTHSAAAELLQFGFDSAMINRNLFDVASVSRLRLEGFAAQHIELYCDGRVSLLCITQEMLDSLGLKDDDLDGLTSVTRRVEGAEVSVTMRQMRSKRIRVSFRSETDFDVSAIAVKFGGGGHKKAAGCSFEISPEEAKATLIKTIEDAFK